MTYSFPKWHAQTICYPDNHFTSWRTWYGKTLYISIWKNSLLTVTRMPIVEHIVRQRLLTINCWLLIQIAFVFFLVLYAIHLLQCTAIYFIIANELYLTSYCPVLHITNISDLLWYSYQGCHDHTLIVLFFSFIDYQRYVAVDLKLTQFSYCIDIVLCQGNVADGAVDLLLTEFIVIYINRRLVVMATNGICQGGTRLDLSYFQIF